MNRLQLRYDVTDDTITLRPFVDGLDLLAGYRYGRGRDPDELLPPPSSRLLATREGQVSIVGTCGCGVAECGALAIRIRRIGGEVRWEPHELPGLEALRRGYRFDLTEYLDAVDDAAGDPPAGEGRGRRVARAVRLTLDRLDQTASGRRIDWVMADSWTSDVVTVAASSLDGQDIHEFSAYPRESDERLAARILREVMSPG